MTFAAASVAILAVLADGFRVPGVHTHESTASRGSAGPASDLSGPNASIVNGQPAAECKWKHQVGLKDSTRGNPYCGGTLIYPDWVLTAAHCLEGEGDRDVYVIAGEHNIKKTSGNEQTIQSSKIYMHPRFDTEIDNDIALIRLSSSMKLNDCVGTARLPTTDVSPGTDCWITGWGALRELGSGPDILQEAVVKTMSNTDCQNTGYNKSQIDSSMLCAQGRNQNGDITDACSGDSGGPLVCGSAPWTVYGATSWGEGCARRGFPGVWARVHQFVKWINDVTGSGSPPPRRRSSSPPRRRSSPPTSEFILSQGSCPGGYRKLNEAECETAAGVLGKKYQGTRSLPDEPSKCWMNHRGRIRYNTHSGTNVWFRELVCGKSM